MRRSRTTFDVRKENEKKIETFFNTGDKRIKTDFNDAK